MLYVTLFILVHLFYCRQADLSPLFIDFTSLILIMTFSQYETGVLCSAFLSPKTGFSRTLYHYRRTMAPDWLCPPPETHRPYHCSGQQRLGIEVEIERITKSRRSVSNHKGNRTGRTAYQNHAVPGALEIG